MKAVRVNEPWQLAGVHYVRAETMVKGSGAAVDRGGRTLDPGIRV